jgi:ABC-type sugar transport system substrate-binding protein
MKKLRVVVSLVTADNDYQLEQASAAKRTAAQLGMEVEVLFSDGDAINQSQQLLKIIQAGSTSRLDAILFEPAGSTGLPQVARAATAAGIGWVVLNHEVDYLGELRRTHAVPFSLLAPTTLRLAESRDGK